MKKVINNFDHANTAVLYFGNNTVTYGEMCYIASPSDLMMGTEDTVEAFYKSNINTRYTRETRVCIKRLITDTKNVQHTEISNVQFASTAAKVLFSEKV